MRLPLPTAPSSPPPLTSSCFLFPLLPLPLFLCLFFLCLIAKVKCNPLFVPPHCLPVFLFPLLPLSACACLHAAPYPLCASYPCLCFLPLFFQPPYPYPITHMPQMSVHQCRVCVPKWGICTHYSTQCTLAFFALPSSLTPATPKQRERGRKGERADQYVCQLPASRLIFATILFLVAFLFRITRERYPVSSLCWIGGSFGGF